jgi:hypothetical protein
VREELAPSRKEEEGENKEGEEKRERKILEGHRSIKRGIHLFLNIQQVRFRVVTTKTISYLLYILDNMEVKYSQIGNPESIGEINELLGIIKILYREWKSWLDIPDLSSRYDFSIATDESISDVLLKIKSHLEEDLNFFDYGDVPDMWGPFSNVSGSYDGVWEWIHGQIERIVIEISTSSAPSMTSRDVPRCEKCNWIVYWDYYEGVWSCQNCGRKTTTLDIPYLSRDSRGFTITVTSPSLWYV